MDALTPRTVLHEFYTSNHLEPDGGNSLPYVKIEATSWFHFYIPNFDARRKAVALHDIHHILTGYSTHFIGECEISAWEIASGCKKHRAAFFIDTSAVMLGVLLHFPKVLRAFARGRKTKNLYHDTVSLEKALDTPTKELQALFGLDTYGKQTAITAGDVISLLLFCLFGICFSAFSLLGLPLVLFYSVYTELRVRAHSQQTASSKNK